MNCTLLLASAAAAASPASLGLGQPQTLSLQQQAVVDSEASAGGAAASEPPTPGDAAAAHPDKDQAIVVTGVRRETADVLGGVSVLDKEDLTRDLRPSLGETLARLPGVSSTSFGPTASAPVLRGLTGERVRVLTDGIGSIDLAGPSPDHIVTIDPLTAQRIEVLRGPAALLFGSGAIGGVVNVVDKRIPRNIPKNSVGVDAILSYGSAANERSANAAIDVPLGGRFVAHADGSYTTTDDLRIGGYVLSPSLRRQALASPDPAVRALAALKGKLPNSASRATNLAGGVAYIDGDLNLGVSLQRESFRYGVPIRFPLQPGVEPDIPTLDGRQTRADVRAEVPLGGLLKQMRVRGGYGSYQHSELNPQGEVQTSFYTKGGEGRVDLVQADRSGWGGTSGVQFLARNVRLVGEEKFLPDSRERRGGLFTLQTLVRGPWRFEGGARVESSKLNATADPQIGNPNLARSFTTVSGSLGGSYELAAGWRAGLSVSDTARAPAVEELFANGPHGGTEAFEVGNPQLKPERSLSVEASVHRTKGPVHLTTNLFYSEFSNFIFQTPTGEVRADLPVYEYRQGQATYYGFELQGDARFGRVLGIDWGADLIGDAVWATVRNFGPAPLIPPLRIIGGVTGSHGQLDGRVELERAFAHNRTAPNETDTRGYTMVNASFDWHPFAANPALTLSLQGHNLFDVDARRSTSLLKDYAPLAGRDIRVSARVGF